MLRVSQHVRVALSDLLADVDAVGSESSGVGKKSLLLFLLALHFDYTSTHIVLCVQF